MTTVRRRRTIRTTRFRPKNYTLSITCCYPEVHNSGATYYIRPREELFDVPYVKWLHHVNQEIDLSTWEGSGTSMMGGPTRIEVSFLLYDGILSHHHMNGYTIKEIEEAIGELQIYLNNEIYEVELYLQERIRSYINNGKRAIKHLNKKLN